MKEGFFHALFLMILMAGMTASGQVLVKAGLKKGKILPGIPGMVRACFRPFVLTGLMLALAAPLVYLQALKILGLSSVYGLNGLTYFFVYALSRFVLKEGGTRLHLAGLILIAGGVVLWSV